MQLPTELQDKIICNEALKESYLSIAAYFRLFAPELLPKDVHKVLYLDGDIIINDSIRPLWDIDVSNVGIAGVADCQFFDKYIYERLDYPQEKSYFNSGVLLMNLDFLREYDFTNRSIAYMAQHIDKLCYFDQDVLNKILVDNKKLISSRYNLQLYCCLTKWIWEAQTDEMKEDLIHAYANPIVIHYCGYIKPWHIRYIGRPYHTIWRKYADMSPWHIRPTWKPYNKTFKALIKAFLTKLGFSKWRLWLPDGINKRD